MKKILSLVLVMFSLYGQTIPVFAEETDDSAAVSFSLRLMDKAVQSGEPNTVISPISAYLALAMASAGAGGSTSDQFQEVLGRSAETLLPYCAALTGELADTKQSTVLRIANSGWLDTKFTAAPAYLNRIASDMDAEVFVRDLAAERTRGEINQWVSDATQKLIPSLLDETLPENSALALINTLYFKGVWRSEFDPNETADKTFHLANGINVSVPFLCAPTENQLFITAESLEGVLLPYDDGKTALLALRGTKGQSAQELVQMLTPEVLQSCIESAFVTLMTLSMPKFTLSCSITMNDALKAMGLSLAFDPSSADFSGMSASLNGQLYISKVLQKVRIGVDEEGTEAAAATVVVMAETAILQREEPLELTLDSPFVYAVMDLHTGIPLFIGCLDDPSLSEAE